jgi:hypothetical protein
VRPPCNYAANALSSWYGACGKDATGVNLVEHGVQQNWQGREWGKSLIGMAGAHNFGCVCGTKKNFFVLLAGNSPVQPLTVVPSAEYIGGNLGTPVVVGRFSNFKSKGFGSKSEYMAGVSTKPAHPLTWDWGHAIHFSARKK